MGGRPGPSSPETTAALKNRAYCHQKNLLIRYFYHSLCGASGCSFFIFLFYCRISIDLAISRALMGKQVLSRPYSEFGIPWVPREGGSWIGLCILS